MPLATDDAMVKEQWHQRSFYQPAQATCFQDIKTAVEELIGWTGAQRVRRAHRHLKAIRFREAFGSMVGCRLSCRSSDGYSACNRSRVV